MDLKTAEQKYEKGMRQGITDAKKMPWAELNQIVTIDLARSGLPDYETDPAARGRALGLLGVYRERKSSGGSPQKCLQCFVLIIL